MSALRCGPHEHSTVGVIDYLLDRDVCRAGGKASQSLKFTGASGKMHRLVLPFDGSDHDFSKKGKQCPRILTNCLAPSVCCNDEIMNLTISGSVVIDPYAHNCWVELWWYRGCNIISLSIEPLGCIFQQTETPVGCQR